MRMEGINLGAFDTVISVSAGFAHGVIPGSAATHIVYVYSVPTLAQARGIAGHWYRFWSSAMSLHVDQWIAASDALAGTLAKARRIQAVSIVPPRASDDQERFAQEFYEAIKQTLAL